MGETAITRDPESASAAFDLWAKTGSTAAQWHALPFHLLDVGSAACSLYARLPRHVQALVEDWLGCDAAEARRLVGFLAASHDVGKANRYFQKKSPDQAQRLVAMGFDLSQLDEPFRHGQATGAFLKPWLTDSWKWDTFTAQCVALAVGGHHGTFFRDCNQSCLSVQLHPWCDIGPALLDDIAGVLKVDKPPVPSPLNPFLGWLSGFVSVADWLGSHERMTVWETSVCNLDQYFAEASRRAEGLLDELNWQTPSQSHPLTLSDLVPAGRTPNGLQSLASEVALDFSLAIVEAPTGEGKTEAAFALAEPRRSSGAGAYFALPTMATANGLFGRVKAYLQAGSPDDAVETKLLHSQSWLFRDKTRTTRNPGLEGDDQETQAQDWFAGSKRGLLAPYGVGTIDQALMAALRAKHGFVRLFALAGKTVVIDEVHAYDVYMANLMDVLIGWLHGLGCQVVMLSATLPRARREAMLREWGFEGDLAQSTYPCITWVDGSGTVRARSFEVQARKPLTLRAVPAPGGELWREGADRLLELVQGQGGLGALVVNTVRDAQSAYDYLKQKGVAHIELDLFHARFTALDREKIERRVLNGFGKDGPRARPRILVATQVVEQSLDLDFDHMVSSLAPIDLLIQRAGRLHRHRRTENGRLQEGEAEDQRPNPILEVVTPAFDDQGAPQIDDFVYSKAVLMQTLGLIKDGLTIERAEDVSRAIESVYSEESRESVCEAWEDKLAEFELRTQQQVQTHLNKSKDATIKEVDDPDYLIVEAFLDLDENDERHGTQLAAKTRLEDRPSITVALLRDETSTIHGGQTADLREALFASVRCTPPFPLWEAFLQIEPPEAWRRKGSLAHTHPLVLEDGRAEVGEYAVAYDSERGLDWRKMNANV